MFLTAGMRRACRGRSRSMESLLYQTKTTDPLTYAVVAGVMLVMAVPACWVPAHRATKVDLPVLLRPQ